MPIPPVMIEVCCEHLEPGSGRVSFGFDLGQNHVLMLCKACHSRLKGHILEEVVTKATNEWFNNNPARDS